MHCLTCPVMRFHYTALNAPRWTTLTDSTSSSAPPRAVQTPRRAVGGRRVGDEQGRLGENAVVWSTSRRQFVHGLALRELSRQLPGRPAQ